MSRRLYRSRTDSVLGGVAGGVADYLDADPSIVRIIWAILAFITAGLFVVLYIVMWIVVPEAPAGEAAAASAHAGAPGATPAASTTAQPAARRRAGSGSGAVVFGLILVGLGTYFLVDEYLPQIDTDLLWPIGLVVLGVVLLVFSMRRARAE